MFLTNNMMFNEIFILIFRLAVEDVGNKDLDLKLEEQENTKIYGIPIT